MATVMGILARERGFDLGGMTVAVEKLMTPPPRRVARLEVAIRVPAKGAAGIDADGRKALEDRANTCPVRLSLLPAIEVPVSFHWG
jgi:putative redox protein